MGTKNLTIMMTDIKGFTARTSDATREDIATLAADHGRLLLPVFNHFGGNVIKFLGDAYMVSFESPTDAVLCGLTIQEVLRQHNREQPEAVHLSVRVAINVGDVNIIDNDVLGEPVNIVARLEGITEAGEVWFTEAVYLAMNRKEVPSTEVGERTFKGIPYPIKVYKVINDPNSNQARQIAAAVNMTNKGPVIKGLRLAPQPSRSATLSPAKLIAALVLGAFIAFMAWQEFSPQRKQQKQIQSFILNQEYTKALDTIAKHLSEYPNDKQVRGQAPDIATAYVNTLISNQEQARATQWLKAQLDTHAYFAPLRPTWQVLDTKEGLKAMYKKSMSQRNIWKWVRDQIAKHPKNPDVPFLIAEQLNKTYIVEALLWLYEESINRGMSAKDVNAWQHCAYTFSRNEPKTNYCKSALELAKAHYPSELATWVTTHIKDGLDSSYANALWIKGQLESSFTPTADQNAMSVIALAEHHTPAEISAAIKTLSTSAPQRLKVLATARLKDENSIRKERRELLTQAAK